MEPLLEACNVEGLGKGVTQDRGVVSYEVPPVAYLPHRGTSEHLIEPTAYAAGALFYCRPKNLYHLDER
jgi:hypothetical protein